MHLEKNYVMYLFVPGLKDYMMIPGALLPKEINLGRAEHLKAVDTIGNCQRPVFSLGVSKHMHKIPNLWKFELDWSSVLREVVCFQMLDFENSNSELEVLKSNSWKITSFSKTTSLQRELFLTMFCTINSSSLLITK